MLPGRSCSNLQEDVEAVAKRPRLFSSIEKRLADPWFYLNAPNTQACVQSCLPWLWWFVLSEVPILDLAQLGENSREQYKRCRGCCSLRNLLSTRAPVLGTLQISIISMVTLQRGTQRGKGLVLVGWLHCTTPQAPLGLLNLLNTDTDTESITRWDCPGFRRHYDHVQGCTINGEAGMSTQVWLCTLLAVFVKWQGRERCPSVFRRWV